MYFVDGMCGSLGGEDAANEFDDASEGGVEEVGLLTADAFAGVRRRLCARFTAATADAPLSFSGAELRVLRLICERDAAAALNASRGEKEKNSEEVFDRLRNKLGDHVDEDTAESVMSAFGATPKNRRAPAAPREKPREKRRACFKAAVNAVIMSNRLHRALGGAHGTNTLGGHPHHHAHHARSLRSLTAPEKREAAAAALTAASRWDFDIWAVYDACGGDGRLAASLVAEELLMGVRKAHNHEDDELIRTFYAKVVEEYEDVPYHNALHGADVLQGMHALLRANAAFEGALCEDTILVALLAALAHDVGHPGLTNNFLVETQHTLAVRYNDHSPLENMHSRVALDLAAPWLARLDAPERKRARFTWIELVLATDMKEHAKTIFDLEHALGGPASFDAAAPANHLPVLKIFIHAADLSNPSKSWRVYERWTACIMEEFYSQADREAEASLALTVPLRGSCAMDKFQLGFLTFIRPLFATANRIKNVDFEEQLAGLDATIVVWQARQQLDGEAGARGP